jgi:ribosomal protein S27AE
MEVMLGEVVTCPGCGAQNNVPRGKDLLRARCGRCGNAFSQWLDQPEVTRPAQRVSERRPGPAKTAAPDQKKDPAQDTPTPVGATEDRLTSPAALRALLAAFVLPLAVFTAVYRLFGFGDPVGALLLILLSAPMGAYLLPGMRDSGGRFVLFLREKIPVTGAASLAMSALFLMAEPDLTAATGDVLGHISALPDEVARLLEPAPPPPDPEVVRSQLAIIDDMLDLLDD